MCDNVLPLSLCYRLAWQAMRQLHPEAIAAIQSKALFGQAEEALLAKIASVSEAEGFLWCLKYEVTSGEDGSVLALEIWSQSQSNAQI